MTIKNKSLSRLVSLLFMLNLPVFSLAAHEHAAMQKPAKQICVGTDISCAKTVTSAFAPNGDLWRVWSNNEVMYFDISSNGGSTFSLPQKVSIPKEKISARNENRPKIGFDKLNNVYLSWASPLSKKYTANVRFTHSQDYGKTFSAPITVNNDNLLAGHSFNEMHVAENGDVSIVWLDGRNSYAMRKQGKQPKGSALYLAQANVNSSESTKLNSVVSNFTTKFSNKELANGTCQCCRIAMDENKSGNLAILWRHVFGDNIREFAIMTLNEQPNVQQYSHDHWHIEGCPHQGGGLSVDDENTYHTVWFNQGDNGKGIFYAYSNDLGTTHSTPLSIGDVTKQAAYANVMSNGKVVDIVWTQFDGMKHTLWHQRSVNKGKSFSKPVALQNAENGADRPFIIKRNKVNYVSWQRVKQGHWIQAL